MDRPAKKIDNYFYYPDEVPLGKGAFGKVYKAYDEKQNNLEVAVKVIPTNKVLESDDSYKLFMRELDILRQITGENIVKLLDIKKSKSNLYIFMELCNGGDLDEYLRKKIVLTEDEALNILNQITNAFICLDNLALKNQQGVKVTVVHRDIKLSNILFHNSKIKLADFGFAKMINEETKNQLFPHTILGTPIYSSPQILSNQPYSMKCDVWSTGICIYKMLTGQFPWAGRRTPELYVNITKIPLKLPTNITENTKNLLVCMLQIDEKDRIDWVGISKHPALKKFRKSSSIRIIEEIKDVRQSQINRKVFERI